MIHKFFYTPWSRFDALLLLGCLLLAAWAAVPTTAVLRPESLAILLQQDGPPIVQFGRATPVGPVLARWTIEVRGPRKQCSVAPGLTVYEVLPDSQTLAIAGTEPLWEPAVVRYQMDSALAACIEPNQPFQYVTTHSARLFGVVPLRHTRTVWTCHGNGGICVN